jgi:putative DNA primase/helicase
MHAEHVRYVKERRQWLAWHEGRWRPDTTGVAERAAKSTARELLRRAASLDGDEQKRAVKWALASQSEVRVRAMLTLASTESAVVLAADQLDADPWLLGCANGTLDLRTGELRDADPADLIAGGTDIEYDPDASCARWLRFLDEVFAGDADLIGFVRRLCGYSLTGDTREHVLADDADRRKYTGPEHRRCNRVGAKRRQSRDW